MTDTTLTDQGREALETFDAERARRAARNCYAAKIGTANHTLKDVLQEADDCVRSLLAQLEAKDARVKDLEAVLAKIERWDMPPTNETWDDGTPMSYSALYGSNGERDLIREWASDVLLQQGSET